MNARDAPDYRRWYDAGVRRGIHIGICIGLAFGLMVSLFNWR